VPPGGYAWWYIDALSDDREHGLAIIALIGSVFSPYYAWSGRQDPIDHCSLNVALYGARWKWWAMTERGRSAVRRAKDAFTIGPSTLEWDGDVLTIRIDEVTAPIPSRIRGVVRFQPSSLVACEFQLDKNGRHRWCPIAPLGRVEVEMEQPGLRWRGDAYLDANRGSEPLEAAFTRWDWLRANSRDGAAVLYDVTCRNGDELGLALHFDASGTVRNLVPPTKVRLPTTGWRVARATRSEGEDREQHKARLLRTLEDTPFYARSLIAIQLLGEPVIAMHESLSLERFRTGWVKLLLPFRMPRAVF
jgi:carotenoid 1,2-hydratase